MIYCFKKLAIVFIGIFLLAAFGRANDWKKNTTVLTKEGISIQVPAWIVELSNFSTNDLLPIENNHREIILAVNVNLNGEKLIQKLEADWVGGIWEDKKKNTFSYDANDNLIEDYTQNWNDSEWVNVSKALYTYDGNNFMTETITKVWRNNAWKDYSRYLITLDEVNHYLLYTVQQYDTTGGLWINFFHMTYYLDSTNKIFLGGLQELWSAGVSSWINFKKDTIIYDANYYKLEELNQDWVGNTWVNMERTVYTNDATGHKLTEMDQDWEDSIWVNKNMYTYERDSNHDITQMVSQVWVISAWENRWKNLYSYDTENREIEEITQGWQSSAWVYSNREATTYDTHGNVSERQRQNWTNGTWVNSNIYLTTANTSGDITEELWKYWDTNTSAWINDKLMTYTFGTTGVEDKTANNVPASFSLFQNYPNPFNPITDFRFRISDLGFTTLNIYNVLGEEIVTLINQTLAPGEYSISWNATSFSSGVYFYRLTVQPVDGNQGEKHTDTKQLILIK